MHRAHHLNNLETLQTARRLVPVLAPEWAGFPAALTALYGREQEVAQVSALLQNPHVRLVSLLGPGGVGKTRLAVAVAENVEGSFPDGAAFVPLAPLSHPGDVPGAVAATLGVISHQESTTTQSIVMALHERRFLLVLDNLEHLLAEGVAAFVLELLDRCPHLHVLVTSREPLRVTREQRYLTPPLSTPDAEQNPQALAELPAVQLFVARASGVRQDFTLSPDDAIAVAEICRRLDGLPLAIELAAAWMRILTPVALLARLTERLPLLAGGNADQPARFQTMRAAISWSYDLLMPREALALRRLSVFRGGFTLEAAAFVVLAANEHPVDADLTMLELVAALCDKSLLAPTDAIGPVQRFTMLETVREFAYEQLAGTDDLARTNVAHAAYFRDWLELIEPDFLGPQEEHWIELFTAELGNLHLALYWGIANDAELAQRMGGTLWAYWCFQNPREGLRWLTDALGASGSVSARVRSRALRTAGAMAVLIGSYDEAVSLTSEALDLALQASAPWLEGEARWVLSICDIFAGRLEQAEHHLTRAVALLNPARTPTEITTAAYVRSAYGLLAFLHGNRAWGIERYDRAVSELRDAGGAGVPIVVFTDYAGWLITLERLSQARQLLHEALHLARRTPTSWLIGGILISLALADAIEGHATSAAYKLGAVVGIQNSRGVTIPIQFQQRVERATALASAAQEPFAFAEAHEYGRLNAAEIVDQLLSDPATSAFDEVPRQAARRLGLTRRECDVLPYLVAGLSDREIASNLFISHRTASVHVGRILQRLSATTRADAAVRAVRLGLV
jgi:predicted ATPase/DNA-binding CsgD family transcriptional regulator